MKQSSKRGKAPRKKVNLNKVSNRAVHEKHARDRVRAQEKLQADNAPEAPSETDEEKELRLGRWRLKRSIQRGITNG